MYEIFRKLLDEIDITPYKVAKETGLTSVMMSEWKRGKYTPKRDKLQKVADYLNVSLEFLMGETDERVSKPTKKEGTIQMPLYSKISCGNGCFADDDIIDYISLPDFVLNANKEYFAQNAKGDSMINANINDGDLLIFEKTAHLENGQIGCFCVDNNTALCKKFYKTESNIIMLQPANDKYEPIAVTVENTCFRILGKLVGVYNKR